MFSSLRTLKAVKFLVFSLKMVLVTSGRPEALNAI
jgi:hypothetical protein